MEASGVDATTICPPMRLVRFFNAAKVVLVGRTGAAGSTPLTQSEAAPDALGTLGVSVVGNVGCGHMPSQLPIINGAQGHLEAHACAERLT